MALRIMLDKFRPFRLHMKVSKMQYQFEKVEKKFTDIMIAFYCLHSVERIVSINFRK